MKRKRNLAFLLFVIALLVLLGAGAYQAINHEEARPASDTSP